MFHLAALIAIPYSYVAPQSFIETNMSGTLNVLEAARRHGVRRVVQTSTSEVYGTPETLPIREAHPLAAQSPYAASKVAADQLALAFRELRAARRRPAAVQHVRPAPVGARRPADDAPQLLAGRTEIRLGRLDPRRDLTFVADTVDGFVRAATAPGIEGEIIQLGTGRTVSIGELFALACRSSGSTPVVEDPARLRPDASEVMVLQSDPARARELLGWEAQTSLEDGLRATVEWLRTPARDQRPGACPALTGGSRWPSRRSAGSAAYLEECLATNFVSSVGPFVERFEASSPPTSGRGTPSPARAAPPRSTWRCASWMSGPATRCSSRPDVRRLGQPDRLLGARRSSSTPSPHWNLDPALVVAELDRRARPGQRQPAASRSSTCSAIRRPSTPRRGRGATRHPGHRGRRRGARRRYTAAVRRPPRRHDRPPRRFCFNGNKIITTGGGGMIVTDDEALARRARHLTTQARLPGLAYLHDEVGYNYRLTNLAAALGVAQLEQLTGCCGAAGHRRPLRRRDRRHRRHPRRPASAWADPSFWLYTAALASPIGPARPILAGLARPASRHGRSGARSTRPGCTPMRPVSAASVADRIFAAPSPCPRRRRSPAPTRTASSTDSRPPSRRSRSERSVYHAAAHSKTRRLWT